LDIHSIVGITDKFGTITYANDEFCRISKYSKDELLGKNHRILKSGFHPSAFYENMWKTISGGRIWKGEIKNKAKDGSHYWVKTIIVPILDEDDKPVEYISIRTDITKQKEMQEKLADMYQRNSKTDKLAAIGEMTARIAHDLKNPIAVIKSELELLSFKNPSLVENNKSSFQRLENSISKITTQIRDIMDFVRTKPLQLAPQSIRSVLESSIFSTIIPETVQVHLANNDSYVMCDNAQIETVFVNLLNNAVEAMNGFGKIWIDISEENSSVIVKIANSGSNIPEQNLEKIFEPLFTTKNSGAGLGLTTCKAIIERHCGTISAKNNPTTFTIILSKATI
jgi:PAS domain S-box-containing protein